MRDFKNVKKDGDVRKLIRELDAEMALSTQNLDFERAALLRDQIYELQRKLK